MNNEFFWKECNVVGLNQNIFYIKWEDNMKEKEIHRVSLLLEFENQNRFLKIRENAFNLRILFENQLRLDLFLFERIKKSLDFKINDPIFFSKIILKNNIQKASSTLLQFLIQDITELYSFSNEIIKYQFEWDTQKDYFLSLNLIKYPITTWNLKNVDKLNQKKLNIKLPLPKIMNNIILIFDKIKNYKLFDPIINNLEVPYEFKLFFKQLIDDIKLNLKQIIDVDLIYLLSTLRSLLENNRYSDYSQRIIKMIDLRLISTIHELIINSLDNWINIFNMNNLFKIDYDNNLNFSDSFFYQVMNEGFQFIINFTNLFDNSIPSCFFLVSKDFFLNIDKTYLNQFISHYKEKWTSIIYKNMNLIIQKTNFLLNALSNFTFKEINNISDF